MKTYTAEKREELVFTQGRAPAVPQHRQSITGVSAITAFSTVVVGVIGMMMIIVGGRAILSGAMTIGEFMTYILFTGLMAAPVVQIASIGTQISEAFAGLDRIRELMQTQDRGRRRSPAARRSACSRARSSSTTSASNTTPGVPVLKNVSFRAPAGTTTALVGSSGSGKSTLISLVMAFNRPLAGRVLIDGRDLTTVRLRDYRSQLGVVLQDNFLFDGTIGDNLRYGSPEATLEQIREVSRIAHADEFIEEFEKKYDTVVGERGVKLSGGQRQRVAIARAILANPKILVLDEATSSLDSESEAMIQDGLRSLRRGRTTFVIAHRLSTIRSADQILVLEHGEIVERGTHAELLALGGRYRTLYDKQYNFEADRFINPGEDFTPEPEAAKVADGRAIG